MGFPHLRELGFYEEQCIYVYISTYRLQKFVKDLTKYMQTQDKGPWPQNKVSALDRALGEVARIMEKKVTFYVHLLEYYWVCFKSYIFKT